MAVDSSGNLYVADFGEAGGRVQRRDPRGRWSILAGHGVDPGQVSDPLSLAVDAAGNLYVADSGNDRVLKYVAEGILPYGDLNADGRVTLADVTLALRVAVGALPLPGTEDPISRADVAPVRDDGTVGDGVIDLLDVTRLLRRAVGLEPDPWP